MCVYLCVCVYEYRYVCGRVCVCKRAMKVGVLARVPVHVIVLLALCARVYTTVCVFEYKICMRAHAEHQLSRTLVL